MISRAGTILLALVALILTLGYVRVESGRTAGWVSEISIDQIPNALGDWSGRELPGLGIRAQQTLQLDQYLQRKYQHETLGSLSLYLGYWKVQTGDHQAAKHSPAVCLPANGWSIVEHSVREIRLDQGQALSVNELRARQGANEHLFWYWFFRGDETYYREWQALIDISIGAFLYGRSDGGIIELSTPIPSEGAAISRKRLESFLQSLSPELKRTLQLESS